MFRKTIALTLIGLTLLAAPHTHAAQGPATATATLRTLAAHYAVKLITQAGDVSEGNLKVTPGAASYALEFTYPTEKPVGVALLDEDHLAFADGPASCTFAFYKVRKDGTDDVYTGQWTPLIEKPTLANVIVVLSRDVPGTPVARYRIVEIEQRSQGSSTLTRGVMTTYEGTNFTRVIYTFDERRLIGVGLRQEGWFATVSSPLATDRCGVGLATLLDDDSIEGSYVQLNSMAITDFLGLRDEP